MNRQTGSRSERVAVIGLVWLTILCSGCAGRRSSGMPLGQGSSATTPGYRYPALFCQGNDGIHGVGFSGVLPSARDSSCTRATAMACRSLSWALQVRVQGERLVEPMPSGDLVFCGESIRLLDVPEITP